MQNQLERRKGLLVTDEGTWVCEFEMEISQQSSEWWFEDGQQPKNDGRAKGLPAVHGRVCETLAHECCFRSMLVLVFSFAYKFPVLFERRVEFNIHLQSI